MFGDTNIAILSRERTGVVRSDTGAGAIRETLKWRYTKVK